MPITVTKKSKAYRAFEGDGMKMAFVHIDLGTYVTNGIAIAPSDVNMEEIHTIILQTPYTTNIKTAVYDVANKKIIAYSDWAASQVAEISLAGQLIPAIIIGR